MNTATQPKTKRKAVTAKALQKTLKQVQTPQAPAEVIARDEKTIEVLTAQVAALTAQLGKLSEVRKPVEDEELSKAIAKLTEINAADRSKLSVSLRSVLGFVPEMTKEQRAVWKPAKKAIERAHSQWAKEHAAEVMAHLRRAVKNPVAIMAARVTKRKSDDKVSSVRMAAKNLAPARKVKGKGKNAAKPAQIAGKVAASTSAHAQAAANPASVS